MFALRFIHIIYNYAWQSNQAQSVWKEEVA